MGQGHHDRRRKAAGAVVQMAWLTGLLLVVAVSIGATGVDAETSPTETHLRFDPGSGPAMPGYVHMEPAMTYSVERGYGFEPGPRVTAVDRGGDDALRGDFCTGDQPFCFSVAVPEGNYRVTVILGDVSGPTSTTVKAELRRLMLEQIETAAGQFVQRSFIVNVRTPRLPDGGCVRLKDREKTSEAWAWDEKLTLEFNGRRPCVCAVEIGRADDLPTVYLLGDSTVCDQPLAPWNSWGQMLTRFFKPEVAIANHAESGESMRSSLDARRVDKVFSLIKPGDYAFVQFGHNDMKSRTPNASDIYKADLKQFVVDVRAKRATPVLITSMERKSGVVQETLRDYPDRVREVAAEDHVALIDLHAMSKVFYQALGDDLDKAFQDGTHHNNYGSYELAKCVVEGIRRNELDLTKDIVDDYVGFDPNRPDPVDEFDVPTTPLPSVVRPPSCVPGPASSAFRHPGMLHNEAELAFIKAKVAAEQEPWKTAWDQMCASRYASPDWEPRPQRHVIREVGGRGEGQRELGNDALASYAQAIAWAISGEAAHAAKAAEILNAWSQTLETMTGHDARLLAGITGYKFCNAAEMLRAGDAGWPVADQDRFERMLLKVYYPVIEDFFPEANGNWDASMIVTMMCVGVFCDDRAIFDRAVDYYCHGAGNGAIGHYVNDFGQCQESGRDQQHTQLGLGYLADACEVAFKQGVDLYGVCGNRLALGFEYTARYNLGFDVPFAEYRSIDGRYVHTAISSRGRGRLRPIFEKVYHHYHDRVGLEMKHTRMAIDKIRPEGEHWDHVSWGTLMYAGLPHPLQEPKAVGN